MVSFRGEHKLEKESIIIHDNIGINIDSEKWDKLFVELKNVINRKIGLHIDEQLRGYLHSDGNSKFDRRETSSPSGTIPMSTKMDFRFKRAIKLNNDNEVKKLVNQISHIDARDPMGRTFLHIAAKYGFNKMIYAQEKYVLHEMIQRQKKIICICIDAGANPNAQDDYGRSPLHYASYNEYAIRVLVESGANINSTDLNKNTILHNMLGFGPLLAVEYLIKSGANIYVKNASDVSCYDIIINSKSAYLKHMLQFSRWYGPPAQFYGPREKWYGTNDS